MSATVTPYWKSLSQRYQLDTQAEWRKLLSHFDLSEGFALIVLLVPDADGAALCHRDLETQLRHEDREMATVEITIPDDLRRLPEHFLGTPVSDNTACLWLSAVAPDYTPDYTAWRNAWEHALARLNAYRNPIRDQFECTLVFVGAPWLQEVFREIAPDLWSVRTLVVRIETAPQQLEGKALTAPQRVEFDTADAPDPQFALSQAEKLRGMRGKELVLADLLHRAGDGFAELEKWRESERLYTEALELKQRHNAALESIRVTLQNLAWNCFILGQNDRSLKLSKQALALSRETGNRLGESKALGNMGIAYAAQYQTQQAIDCYEQQLKIVCSIGDKQDECAVLSNLGLAYAELDEMQRAIKYLERSLLIAREIGDQKAAGRAIGNLGDVYLTLGDIRRAIKFYKQALVVQLENGNKRNEGSVLGNLGSSYMILGQMQRAIEYLEQSLFIAQQVGDRRIESNALGNLGIAYATWDKPQSAIEYSEQHLKIAREINDRRAEGIALWNLSLARNALCERSQAIELANDALLIFQQIADNGRAALVQGQLEEWGE